MTSRRKGKDAENELASLINSQLGDQCLARNLVQTRNGGHDLIVTHTDTLEAQRLDTLAIEVKRHKQVRPSDIRVWWDQAVRQAKAIRKVPVLFFRGDREDWQAMLPLSEEIGFSQPEDCITMGVSLFIKVIREPNLVNDLTDAGYAHG